MLDYSKLDKAFDNALKRFSKDSLEGWLAFDRERELLEKLRNGEAVDLSHNTQVSKLLDKRESYNLTLMESNNYALAA
ncbi:MAG: hypothetical protein IT261_13185 [Saprospiraceae bacterium]|nr:hypothetical protein [Saprospiraceae bacterium]